MKLYNKLFFSFLSFLILLGLGACEPQISVPEYDSKLVVDGFIEAGYPPEMYLTYSSSFINDYDSLAFIEMVKFNVSAYIITEENDTIGFTRRSNSGEFPPYKYTMSRSDLVGEAGKSYRLLVRKSGREELTAITKIPNNKPIIFGMTYVAIDEYGGYCHLKIKKDGNQSYCFIQNHKNEEIDYYPVKLPARSTRFFEGDTLSYSIYYRNKTNVWSSDGDTKDNIATSTHDEEMYHPGNTYVFKIGSIDVLSYDVMSSIFIDTEFPNNPFKPISQLPESNIVNGIGHWTGMNSKYISVYALP